MPSEFSNIVRACLQIDGPLAARECAGCQGRLDGWRGTGKYLVFTYSSMPFIFRWDFHILHTSIATPCFDHLARIIQDGRKLGKNFRTVYWEFMLVNMALSSFTIQILTLDS